MTHEEILQLLYDETLVGNAPAVREGVEQGLADVSETELMIRMDYRSFDDFWAPIAAGEGPLGKYVAALDAAERARVDAAVRDAYEAGRPDGPRSFANVAWACRGIVR